MSIDSFGMLMTGVCSGGGLSLLGAANVVLRRSTLALRLPVSLAIVAGVAGVAYAATDSMEVARRVSLLLASASGVFMLIGSDWLASLVAFVRRPAVRWSVASFAGFTFAIGAVAYSEFQEELATDRHMAELEALSAPPPSQVPAARAQTDSGREVALKEATAPRDISEMQALEDAIFSRPNVRDNVIRSQPASDKTNCHGWVFTGGKFWVSGSEVDSILADNRYRIVSDPQPGDLVVYRNDGAVSHTALVRYVTEQQPVLVEGKWGCSGVYLHPVDKSIYGEKYQFYRSSRKGHLLAGIRGIDPNTSSGSPQVLANPANPDEFTE